MPPPDRSCSCPATRRIRSRTAGRNARGCSTSTRPATSNRTYPPSRSGSATERPTTPAPEHGAGPSFDRKIERVTLSAMAAARQLLIGGEHVDGADGGYDSVNPATEEGVGVAPEASVQQARDAARAARDAFDSWSQTAPAERAGLLQATA